ncbi:LacI family transcriptional regulator [Agromyces protaetiae]|uniref:LacI family transcriptional regulator n=1 Tax=Agromyces protaetiae TaxID=2509455 RepID=A0A4P6FDC6_9MICO|nr:LacI family DNA-binding transcriptional regulator [Agromyces protaetiae]QAY74210.1 LacI family transcriptional regulator [Agromyces protaetiae]
MRASSTEASRHPDASTDAARARKVRIRDVAAAAGVSTATVSYVLNDVPGQTITEATRERVRAAVASLGYVPHGLARALREGMSRIVLLNVGSFLGGEGLDTFITGMSDELRALGHSLLVTTSAERGGVPADAVEALAPRAVLDLARLLGEPAGDDPFAAIVDGDRAGLAFHTRTQLGHLVARGHRRIAFALPDVPGAALAATRAEHVTAIARELGLELERVMPIDLGDDRGRRASAMRALVDETSVTAVAGYSDEVALAVLGAIADLGLSAPDDLAVIGFDDARHGQLWRPSLTTVRIDSAGFGRRAARVVLGLEPGEWRQPPSEVVVRESA